jgi:NADH/NAD ratio-sensing transcriptional regulator Rex
MMRRLSVDTTVDELNGYEAVGYDEELRRERSAVDVAEVRRELEDYFVNCGQSSAGWDMDSLVDSAVEELRAHGGWDIDQIPADTFVELLMAAVKDPKGGE